MPGKHAPESPWSFYVSVGRSVAGALAVLGVVILIAVVAVSSRSDETPRAADTPRSTVTPTTSVEPTRTARPSRTAEPVPSVTDVRPPSEVTIQVLNANGRTGAAGEASAELEAAGYQTIEPSNAEVIARTIIYYAPGFEAEAEELRRSQLDYVRPARVRPREDGVGDQQADIVVVLGRDHPA